MKKILFALLLAIGTTTLFAQDIIITKESVRIDAKILEITDYEVKYLQYGDPNERVFNIKASNVASIMFENGEVHTFNVQQSEPEGEKEDLSKIIQNEFDPSNYNGGTENYDSPISYITKPGSVVYKQGLKINFDKKSGRYYYGNYMLNRREFIQLLKQNCPDAYKMHKIGTGLAIAGGTLAIGSEISFFVALFGNLSHSDYYTNTEIAIMISSGIGMLAGLGLIIGGGIADINKPIAIFNERCADWEKERTASLSLSLSPVGAGLTLKF